MAQQETGLEDKTTGNTFSAAEFNTLKDTIDQNANDAESRLAGCIGIASIQKESSNYDIKETGVNKDLGQNKLIYVGDDATDDVTYTLPDTAGLEFYDSIVVANFSDYMLTIQLADDSNRINGNVTQRTLVKGQGFAIFYPIAALQIWMMG